MIRETEIEKYLKNLVEDKGGVCWEFTSSTSGVPDRLVFLPAGIVGFCEVKKQRGVQQIETSHEILPSIVTQSFTTSFPFAFSFFTLGSSSLQKCKNLYF